MQQADKSRSIKSLMDLSGRTALVVGGCGHIGRLIVETLIELDAKVIILDKKQEVLENVCTHFSSKWNLEVTGFTTDLAKPSELRNIPNKISELTSELSILVNCASIVGTDGLKGWNAPFAEQNLDAWDRAMQVNVGSVFQIVQLLEPMLRDSQQGSIVNFSSIYGVVGPNLSLYEGTSMNNPAAYAVSKGGLIQLTRWLATVLAPYVRVNCISPGGIYRQQDQKFVSSYTNNTPLKRMGVEEDMKGAVAFLTSDMSSWMTGQNLIIDGGYTAW